MALDKIKNSKVMFIYNPSSGRGQILRNLPFIMSEIKKKYDSCDVVESKSKEHFQETIRTACESYDYIFFSGGDGTFNLVVNSIPNIKNLPIFGYLPGGSTNDMGYNLNISKNIKRGIRDLLNSKPKTYNVGYIGDTKFIYVACCGTLTSIAHLTPADKKRKFGLLAYGFYGIKAFFSKQNKSTVVVIDGVIYKSPLIFISNSREIANFRIKPEQSQRTGKYYVCIVKNGIIGGVFNIAYLFAFGVEAAVKRKVVDYFESPIIKLNSDNNHWDIDGERADLKFPTTCGYNGFDIQVLCNRE